jgi:hypothetical protein
VPLSAGTHRIRLTRGNGSLAPGSGDGPDTASGVIGPLIFRLTQPGDQRMQVAPASQAARLCAARVGYEWIEILAPGSHAFRA